MKKITISVPDDCEVQVVKKDSVNLSKGKLATPVIRTYQDLIDNKVSIEGAWIDNKIHIQSYGPIIAQKDFTEDIAKSKKVAKSMLAMAMISQLLPYYGGEITDEEWKDENIDKYTLERWIDENDNEISKCNNHNFSYYFLSFHTREQRDEFLKYNEQLVKDYLMIE